MFSEVEAKIEQARRDGSPSVPTLLGLLSRAQQAEIRGDRTKAEYLITRALKER